MSTPPQNAGAAGTSYPGQRLGLPADGTGSVAGWSRRFAALFIDLAACSLIMLALPVDLRWLSTPLFIVEVTVLTVLLGGSFGQIALRVAVVRLDGRPVSLLAALVRTLAICAVVPPLVFNPDQRGLHDLAVGTVTVRR
ncbi:MAG: RDD family protein [Nocardioidaceae bacterium]